jgi:putative redox protein
MIDAGIDNDSAGYRPKALMLSSLAGCSGLDVVSLLKNMRAEVENFEIDVSANLTDEHPKYFDKVHVEYKFYGSDFKKDKIEKAVNLSEVRYCGVMEMFRQFAEVTTEIVYIEQ